MPSTPGPIPALAALGTAPRDPADVGRTRERQRQRRLLRIAVVLAVPLGWFWGRLLAGEPPLVQPPRVDPFLAVIVVFFTLMLGVMLATTVVASRSPHVTYRPEDLDVGLSDVVGLGPVRDEAVRTVDLFLAGRTFRHAMGGTPRRGLLFEGPPGTGKTFLAKAMARDAGVPFLFVSATSFQSMYYGATARRIRSYFAALRRAARREGGAIGFIEEIDAIATARGGLRAASTTTVAVAGCGGLVGLPEAALAVRPLPAGVQVDRAVVAEGVGGVVNELLVQMQSFDAPAGWQRVRSGLVDAVNLVLPHHRRLPRPRVEPAEILLVAATNRADALDPALLRPGRFDRRLTFDAPDRHGRREVLDHYLARKAHGADLAGDVARDQIAALTTGYTPVMIENLLDEALVQAVRRGAAAMSWDDVVRARLLVEVGPGRPVRYTEREQRLIATHEAGHAVVAWRVAPQRRLEVLSIVKRGPALGLLAHGDADDVHTRSRSELEALIAIAFGGLAAEEEFTGEVSTGPASDLAYATRVAAQMVGAAGMSGSPVSVAAGGGPVGGDLVSRVLADARARDAVEALLAAQRSRAREVVARERHLVVALRDALLERHELVGGEIGDVLDRAAGYVAGQAAGSAGSSGGSPNFSNSEVSKNAAT
ncbi:MAG: AAA family ATPase [Kineosporiaceae bacterium]